MNDDSDEGSVVGMAIDDLSGAPVEELGRILVGAAAHESAAKARFLAALAEFVDRRGWERWACVSPVQWLSWQCGFNRVTASEHLRVAGALRSLPRVAGALASGALSWTKVRELTRVAQPATEDEWLNLGLSATGTQLETLVRAFRRTDDRPPPEPPPVSLVWTAQPDGTMVFTLRASGEVAAALVAAIADDTVPAHGVPIAERRAEALIRRVVGPQPVPAPEVVVHLDQRVGAGGGGGTGGTMCMSSHGVPVRPDEAETAICQGRLTVAEHHSDGTVTTSHSGLPISRRVRRLLEARDRSCRFPGCHLMGSLDAHHLRPRHRGGPNTVDNLSLVCPGHHRLIHRQRLLVTHYSDGSLTIAWPDGTAIEQLSVDPQGRLVPRPTTDPRAACTAEPLHLADTVQALWANQATAERATAERATAERATAERATAERATAERATAERATAGRAA